jgi:ribonuclease P protein component
MTRAAEFGMTVRQGIRVAQPDIVVHVRRDVAGEPKDGPRIGLVVGKAVGIAVLRHRVSRRLRHISRTLIADLPANERVVIRALPSSGKASSTELERQLRMGLRRAHEVMERKGEPR